MDIALVADQAAVAGAGGDVPEAELSVGRAAGEVLAIRLKGKGGDQGVVAGEVAPAFSILGVPELDSRFVGTDRQLVSSRAEGQQGAALRWALVDRDVHSLMTIADLNDLHPDAVVGVPGAQGNHSAVP